MNISIFDIYNIGIGPSSSHTVGPMRAGKYFVEKLIKHDIFEETKRIQIHIYGSLAATGRGHGTDKALLLGLEGYTPEDIDVDKKDEIVNEILKKDKILLLGRKPIDFIPQRDMIYKPQETLPHHPNGLLFKAYNSDDKPIYNKIYYSTGGGFLVGAKASVMNKFKKDKIQLKYPFRSAKDLLEVCAQNKKSISQIVFENELHWNSEQDVYKKLDKIWNTMQESVKNGCKKKGVLPGSLKLKRRAYEMYNKLKKKNNSNDALRELDWVNLYALAVNEVNADGGRIVTAPTNGAAGILPAVMHYYINFCSNSSIDGIYKMLLCSGAIAMLYKTNASISGAEVGCQGEVGVACSMAAAGLTEALGGSPEQVENAAEIGMEHNLGLTCDPIDGLVQIPCIERNAMGAVKAINASRMALDGDGKHYVSLDMVIKTMLATGHDMKVKYKETSMGGLAVNITEC